VSGDHLEDDIEDLLGEPGSMWVPLTAGRFRERRFYLGPEAFADPGDGLQAPTDLIDPRLWLHLMDSPTDVVLQTTDHFGLTFRAMGSLAHMWICAIEPPDPLDPTKLPLVFDTYLDAYDEFEAAPFIAAHGWYRQGSSGLRNALEAMAHAAAFSVRGDRDGYAAWRSGAVDAPKFANSLDLIAGASAVADIESAISAGSMFGPRPAGVLRNLYQVICQFTHGDPGHTNADLWDGSNGPIFNPEAFKQFWRDFRDIFLACCILLKIACPSIERPIDLSKVAEHAGAPWAGLARVAVDAYFA
jgi:hypothetical protein